MAATEPNFHGAKDNFVDALPVNEAIDVVYGDTATLLTRPAGATVLHMYAYADVWLFKPGDYSGDGDPVPSFPAMPTATTTDTTAGNAPYPIAAGDKVQIAAPETITVKGADANSTLVYYWC